MWIKCNFGAAYQEKRQFLSYAQEDMTCTKGMDKMVSAVARVTLYDAMRDGSTSRYCNERNGHNVWKSILRFGKI